MKNALTIFFACIVFLLAATAGTARAADCQFQLGFKTLRDLIGHEIVGECLENEYYNAIGDSNQRTTGGLMAWRKADIWTAFTDGYRTWINGPNGLVQRLNTERFMWEADYEEVTPESTPEPACNPNARGIYAGSWIPFSNSDPLTDDVWVGVALPSSEYDADWPYEDDDALLVVRCRTYSGKPRLELFISWKDHIGSDDTHLVALRFGSNEAYTSDWTLSLDNDATFSDLSSRDIPMLCTADRLVARVWKWNDESLTAVWDVRGFAVAARSIIAYC